MVPIESRHPRGLVGVAAGELARYTEFLASFSGLFAPGGSNMVIAAGYDVAYNRNDCIRQMLASDAQWVQLWDDDHTFDPKTLLRLLDREVEVVVPLYTQRQPPFYPCIFKAENADGTFTIVTWEELEGCTGLLPVISAGAGGLLLRRSAIEKLSALDPREKPEWFERQGKTGEDHIFFKKCRAAGITPYVDLDVPIEHMTPVKVRPHRNAAGQWCGAMDVKRGQVVEFWSESYRELHQGVRGPDAAAGVNAVQEDVFA